MNAIYTFTSAFALAATVGLAACGGGHDEAPAADNQARAAAVVEPTLLDDEGRPTVSQPVRQGGARIASARQAESLERALGPRVLSLQVPCCGADDAEQAEREVYGQQVARALPSDAPVLVRSADPKLALAVAQRLSDTGFSHVWAVEQ